MLCMFIALILKPLCYCHTSTNNESCLIVYVSTHVRLRVCIPVRRAVVNIIMDLQKGVT